MTQDLIKSLRKSIDEKHAEALKALETLKIYLDSAPLTNGRQSSPVEPAIPTRRRPTGSIRARVTEAFHEPRTVRSAAEALGMTTRQVRGVIGSPDIRDSFVPVDEVEGVNTYQYRPEGPEDE